MGVPPMQLQKRVEVNWSGRIGRGYHVGKCSILQDQVRSATEEAGDVLAIKDFFFSGILLSCHVLAKSAEKENVKPVLMSQGEYMHAMSAAT